MEKWEYKSLLCDGSTMEATLTAAGEEGWEAVGFAPVVLSASSFATEWIHQQSLVQQWSAAQYRVLLKRHKS